MISEGGAEGARVECECGLPHDWAARARSLVVTTTHTNDGLQVQLELAHVLAVLEPHIEEEVHVSKARRIVEAVLRAHDDQFARVPEERLNGESELRHGHEQRACAYDVNHAVRVAA